MHYMIVYPCGNRKRLAVADVCEFEVADWDVANPRRYDYTPEGKAEAEADMEDLARRHGLESEGPKYIY